MADSYVMTGLIHEPGWKVRAMRKGKVGEHVSARAEAD